MRFERDQLAAAEGERFVMPHQVRFQDIDAAGIVFYPRILEVFHDAYVAFLDAHGAPLADALRTGAYLAPIKHAEADFMRPMRFGDRVEVALVKAHLEGSELTIGYRITQLGGETIAVGQTVHVYVDRDFKRVPPPAVIAQAFARLSS